MNGLALCAGVGGLELGLRLAFGDTYRTVCHVEREAFAAATLVARMEDQTLDQAPVWDDLATFDGKPWRGVVDLLSAGFPCPPFSSAGKRKGTEDDRWLWPLIAPIVEAVRPPVVCIEQVDDFLGNTRALGWLLSDLHALGFDAEWALVSAASVGAPQKRERVFILALADPGREHVQRGGLEVLREAGVFEAQGLQRERIGSAAGRSRGALADASSPGRGAEGHLADDNGTGQRGLPEHERGALRDHADGCGEALGNSSDQRRERGRGARGRRSGPADAGPDLADTDGERRDQALSRQSSRVGPLALGLFPPGKDELDAWARVLGSVREVEPALCSMADGVAPGLDVSRRTYRSDQLRCVGNGVVPLAAAFAFRSLAMRFEASVLTTETSTEGDA